ncbi:MAG: carboxymuconolactone decarboxylase family protein [Streptosporangiales bacterium]|nr:carboxymuconolactone decarboxylase family protein [Streptosporangiales bacterium]
MSRITPLEPPYDPEIGTALRRWMPPGVTHAPLSLFRVLHREPELASRMRVLGAGLLAHGRLSGADRETVIARVCARAGCGYEWGVHIVSFARSVGLTEGQISASAGGGADDVAWTPRQRTLVRAVDELHDTARLSDAAWDALTGLYDEAELLEFLVLAGWYRAIAQLANALRLDGEPWAEPMPAGPWPPSAPR